MSVVFYGVWDKRAVLFLLTSILVNYLGARLIWRFRDAARTQTLCLVCLITINLGALCYFKYLFPLLNFFHSAGALPWTFANVILPLGISFFTFTQIAYLIDLQGGEAELESFRNYAFFVTFFPHLIAGPILHHHEIMPQLERERSFHLNSADVSIGFTLFVIGLFKKVILADKIAPYVTPLFTSPVHASFGQAWAGALCYAMQLYFDFSGYSDMAIGLARMFSIRFPLNFNSPYKAKSIIDFWQRWHMTLTRYLTLYVYNPVSLAVTRREMKAGRKYSPRVRMTAGAFSKRLAFPTIFTMFLAGIWHGAGLQFLVFGLLHGMYLAVNHAFRIYGAGLREWARPASSRFPQFFAALSVLVVFVAVIVGQIFFRAHSAGDASQITASLFGFHGFSVADSGLGKTQVLFLIVLLAVVWVGPNSQNIVGYSPDEQLDAPQPLWKSGRRSFKWQPSPAWAILAAAVFIMSLFSTFNRSEFLYFQF